MAGAVDALDAGHFDIGGGGGAGDGGDGDAGEERHFFDGFGDEFDELLFKHATEMIIRNQGDGAAAFGGRVAEDDSSGGRDGDGTARENALATFDFVISDGAILDESKAPGQPAIGDIVGGEHGVLAALNEDVVDGGRDFVGLAVEDAAAVVEKAIGEELVALAGVKLADLSVVARDGGVFGETCAARIAQRGADFGEDFFFGGHVLPLVTLPVWSRFAGFAVSPPIAEGLLGDGGEIAEVGPTGEQAGEMAQLAVFFEGTLGEASELLSGGEAAAATEREARSTHGDAFGQRGVTRIDGFGAEMDQDFGDVDFYRADFVTRAAKRRGIGQGLGVLHGLQLRGQDCADGSGVDRAVGVAAGLLVNGAGVKACAAANAIKGFAGGWISENISAAIVEQDDVKLFGAVAGRDAGPKRVVRVHALACGGAGQSLQKNAEIAERGDDFLDTGESDQDARQSKAHAAIAF